MEGRPLAGADAVVAVDPQRQVHEHGEAQPVGVQEHGVGRSGADQAVDDHEPAVRDVVERGRERDRPGHGEHPHRPAEAAQLLAQPTVVDVAAAGSLGVVERVRDDDVDRSHSARS
ncbi:MAG: hypothetical protein FWF90_10950 [Promicromonosporaceae bacterium]|nr:hypothetical protein [Promicromonosporaceae bacterium]